MSNVVSLSGSPTVASVNGAVVRELERLLDDARNGRCVALMWVAKRFDDTSDVGWANTPGGISLGNGLVALNYKYGQAAWGEE